MGVCCFFFCNSNPTVDLIRFYSFEPSFFHVCYKLRNLDFFFILYCIKKKTLITLRPPAEELLDIVQLIPYKKQILIVTFTREKVRSKVLCTSDTAETCLMTVASTADDNSRAKATFGLAHCTRLFLLYTSTYTHTSHCNAVQRSLVYALYLIEIIN